MSVKAFNVIMKEIIEYLREHQIPAKEYDKFVESTYSDLEEKSKLAGSAINCEDLEKMLKQLKERPKALEFCLKTWIWNYKKRKKALVT
jgi:argininosuccinate synthase